VPEGITVDPGAGRCANSNGLSEPMGGGAEQGGGFRGNLSGCKSANTRDGGGTLVVWTVETWRVEEGREAHFLEHCGGLVPDELTLYRDLESPGLFWSPTRWESREVLEAWRAGSRYAACLDALREDVIGHQTHVMAAVEGFVPQRDAR
jgi:heme-degrading monooxygenase HmoA